MQALNAELGAGRYKVIELENRADMAPIQDYLLEITGGRSVPRVFIAGTTAPCRIENRSNVESIIV